MTAVAGGRHTGGGVLKGESNLADGEGILERLINLVRQAPQLSEVEIKLPEVQEISLYGLE